MSVVRRLFWTFTPTSDACNLCQDMEGNYHVEPRRPHLGCECHLSSGLVPVEEQDRHTDIIDRYEMLDQIACKIPKGGSSSVNRSWSTGTSVGTSVGASGGGVSVGGSVSQSTGTSYGESVSFSYNDAEGGDYQIAFVVYEVTVYQETVNWLVKWSEIVDGVPDEPFSTMNRWDERVFMGYRQVGF